MIPVFVIVRNRLTTTQRLAHQSAALPDAVPILIDNDSTWQPLLDWYATCDFEVVRLADNVGHHAPWLRVIPQASEFEKRWGVTKYIVTDCDLDIGECPSDLLSVLAEPFEWPGTIKAGLGLRIDDLPPWQEAVAKWESRWWKRPVDSMKRFYHALIDTTFAMYDVRTPHATVMRVVGVKSFRTGPPYLARHVPWYLDSENLDEENRHYFATANGSNSWKPSGKGLASRFVEHVW